jgi:hypothetical protein
VQRRLQGADRTNHETVQASPKLGTSEQHPQCAKVPLQKQREHRHPQDVRELPTQRIKAKPAERRDKRSDIEEESDRRDAGGSRVMTSTIYSLFTHRPAAHAVRRTVHQRHGRSAYFFRGVLIGLAILIVIWLVIG